MLYSREQLAFGEFSLFLVFSVALSGLSTGFLDAKALQGRPITTSIVLPRIVLSLVCYTQALALSYLQLELIWINFFQAVSVALSVSILELIHATLISRNKFVLVTASRMFSSVVLLPILVISADADPYAAYTLAVLSSAVFSISIFFFIQREQPHFAKPERSQKRFDCYEFREGVLSFSLRSFGSAPVLFAALSLGTDFAGAILLAQKFIALPMGFIMNLILLPSMIASGVAPGAILDSALRYSFPVVICSIAAVVMGILAPNYMAAYTIGAFILVGLRFYCERIIYSAFLFFQEARRWIYIGFAFDSIAIVTLVISYLEAFSLPTWLIFGLMFMPTFALGCYWTKFYRLQS